MPSQFREAQQLMGISDSLMKLFGPTTNHTLSVVPESRDYPAMHQKSIDIYYPNGVRSADWATTANSQSLRDLARKNITVYTCITLYSDAISDAPLRVYQRNPKGETVEVPNHRVRQILDQPNPKMGEAEFFSLLVMTMGYHGYAVIEKVRSNAGLPVELYPLRPDWLSTDLDKDGTRRFAYRIPRNPVTYYKEEDLIIIPWRQDPNMTGYGLSPLHIAAKEIGVDVALTDLLKVFLDSGGIPPYVFTSAEEIYDQSAIEIFQLQWQQKYGGSRAYAVPPVLHGGYTLSKVGDGIGEMAWPDLRNLTELKIASAFGVPPDLIGAMKAMEGGSLTTTEMEGALGFFQRNRVQPVRTHIESKLTTHLLREYVGNDASFELKFDLTEILSLQEDRTAVETRALAAYDSGAITLNQFLAETSRPTQGPAGDIYKVPFSSSFMKLSDLASPPDDGLRSSIVEASFKMIEAGGVRRKYRNEKAMTLEELEFRAKSKNSVAKDKVKLSEIGARKLRIHFRDQGKRIVDKLEKGDAYDLEGKTIAPLDWDAEYDLIKELMMKFYNETGKRAFATTSDMVGVSLQWEVASPEVSRVMNELGKQIVGINETTRSDVAKVISDATAEGLTTRDTAEKITGLFEETYKNRSRTIAHTETMRGYNLSQVAAYKESDLVDEAELFDNPTHDTDPGDDGLTCAERNGLVVPLDSVPMHVAAEHPNGSLSFGAILKKPLGEV